MTNRDSPILNASQHILTGIGHYNVSCVGLSGCLLESLGVLFKCVLRQPKDLIPKCRHLCVKIQQCMQCRQGRRGKTLFTKCRSCEGSISANLCRSNRSKTQTTQPGEKQKKDGLEPVRNISLQRRWLCHSCTSLMDSKNQEPKWDGMGFASALGSRYSVKAQGLRGG